MNKTAKIIYLGIPTTTLILLLILKLTNIVAWSWFWILSPIWISYILILLFIKLIIILMLLPPGEELEEKYNNIKQLIKTKLNIIK